MKKLFRFFQLYVLLILFWFAISGKFSWTTLYAGTFFSLVVVLITQLFLKHMHIKYIKLSFVIKTLHFAYVSIKHIIKSAVYHSLVIFRNDFDYKIVDIYLNTHDSFVIAMIANVITLSPGTVTMGIYYKHLKVISAVEREEDVEKVVEDIMLLQKPFSRGAL